MSRAARTRRTTSSLLDSLSAAPKGGFGTQFVFHGTRILLFLMVSVLLVILFPPQGRLAVAGYEVGMVSGEDVIAQISFSVPKNRDELERDRTEAASAVPPTFRYRPEAADTMSSRLERFFSRVDSVGQAGGSDAVQTFFATLSIQISTEQAGRLLQADTLEMIRRAASRAAQEVLPRGVVDASQTQLLTVDRLVVRPNGGGAEQFVPRDQVLTQGEFYEAATALLPLSAAPDLANALRLILIQHLEFSYEFDLIATEMDRDAARQSVPLVKANVAAGAAILRANDQIGDGELEILSAYERALAAEGQLEEADRDVLAMIGGVVLNLILLGVFLLLVFFFRPQVYRNVRWILLVALLIATYFVAAAAIAGQGWPSELLPIVFVVLPVAILWDGRMALVLALVLAVLTGAQPPFSGFGPIVLTLVGGAAAALSAQTVHRRSQVWAVIAIIVGGYALTSVALALLGQGDPTTLLLGLARAGGNTTASTILAVGFIPVFEWFTGITTDQTLLEWADPNRPLLRRLSLEASGTYAHTINVSNLAEAAANAIGANGLLCRVGGYYHDVGKMSKPQYFIENQPTGRNPHDKLRPETSASVVREHVLEGLRLAKEAKVPKVVQAFISEHHGTQLIGFFHDRAVDEANGTGELKREEFCYPGPKPQSKETALLMIADSIEGTARALQDPTPERIRDLVDTIVDGKIQDGQLDEAPLTLREVTAVKEQLVKVLSGMYHQRIDYPSTKHITDAPADEVDGAEPGNDQLEL